MQPGEQPQGLDDRPMQHVKLGRERGDGLAGGHPLAEGPAEFPGQRGRGPLDVAADRFEGFDPHAGNRSA